MNTKDPQETRHPFNAETRAELYSKANGSALDTIPDEPTTLRFIAVRWYNGNFGQRRNGEGSVSSGGEGWQFKGSFLASGREVYFTKRNLLDLQTVLRGRGWLPETNSGMVGE